MRKKALKLILSGAASLALAVSLTATTFAYVLIGNNATVEEFDFKVEGQEGLLISLDGNNYSQDISSDQLKSHLAGSVDDFNKLKIESTSIKQSGESVVKENGELVFERQVVNFLQDEKKYERSFDKAERNYDYFAFDLYFLAQNTAGASEYSLTIGEDSYVAGVREEIELVNTFSTWEYQTNTGKYKEVKHNQGDKVTQNLANATRVAITSEEPTANPLTVLETADIDNLGSAAINGRTDKSHDPYSSMMLNYYNKVFPLYPYTLENTSKEDEDGNLLTGVQGAEDGEAFTTLVRKDASSDAWKNHKIGTIKTGEKLKVTVYIWLEGWDADCLLGSSLEGSKISCKLDFNLANV